ncbi:MULTISPECIES: PilW family protein [unclassified Cupriavidus]|uniref:PilW family protein n=1 Tax=Cupriavidus sp. H19C3 TaxID=3241603 RepID=UPI003BF7F21F
MTRTFLHSRRRVSGFTLVELMVGMVISLLLILVASSLYISQQRSNNTQGDLGEIQENARAIAQLLQRQARQVGYTDFTFTANTFGANETLDASNDDGANTSDSLTFRYFGSSLPGGDPAAAPGSASAPKADGTVVDCSGNDVNANVLVSEVFSIAKDAAGTPWLQCTANGGAPTPLFPGVESFQVLLGEDTDGDQTINRYVAPGAAVMANVRALRVSLILRGRNTTNPRPESLVVNHFGATYAPANAAPAGDAGSVTNLADDGRLYKHYTFFIALRNRLN